tara:strand:- start:21 stop:200 length:180 start_codon:yes stop_codon:yes gene_type:complete
MLKAPRIVTFIVAGIFASNPAVGILCVVVSTVLYWVARKCRQVLAYCAPEKNLDAESGD